MTNRQQRLVFIVSDASGAFGSRAIEVAREQFPTVEFKERLFPETRTINQLDTIFSDAKRDDALIIFTLVNHQLVDHAHELASVQQIPAIDLMAELIPGISRWVDLEPSNKPGHRMGLRQQLRARTVDFARRHDDGQNVNGLISADVVILGLSRASKTPVCHELAMRLYRAGNIPIVMADDALAPLPLIMESIHPQRVVVLTISAARLSQVRESRALSLGEHEGARYASLPKVRVEIELLNQLLRKHPEWMTVDVTRKSVEETASLITVHLQKVFNK